MATIEKITVFPLKSFDGVDIEQATTRANGSLEHDREYRFVREADGKQVDSLAKSNALYLVRVAFGQDLATAHFSMPGIDGAPEPASFNLQKQPEAAAQWMSKALGYEVKLQRNSKFGFYDDYRRKGPTIISSESLQHLAEVTQHSDMKRRIRANVVVRGLTGTEEELLYNAGQIRIGGLTLKDALPCIRCNVPARDPETGTADSQFIKRFMQDRQDALMPIQNAHKMRISANSYIASMNTRADGDQKGAKISIGDTLEISGKRGQRVR